jgi:tRNA(fMet)-specific endonuclease VapC
MFVLDTDILAFLQRRTQPESGYLERRMDQFSFESYHVTVVSLLEQILGANNYISISSNA